MRSACKRRQTSVSSTSCSEARIEWVRSVATCSVMSLGSCSCSSGSTRRKLHVKEYLRRYGPQE